MYCLLVEENPEFFKLNVYCVICYVCLKNTDHRISVNSCNKI